MKNLTVKESASKIEKKLTKKKTLTRDALTKIMGRKKLSNKILNLLSHELEKRCIQLIQLNYKKSKKDAFAQVIIVKRKK